MKTIKESNDLNNKLLDLREFKVIFKDIIQSLFDDIVNVEKALNVYDKILNWTELTSKEVDSFEKIINYRDFSRKAEEKWLNVTKIFEIRNLLIKNMTRNKSDEIIKI